MARRADPPRHVLRTMKQGVSSCQTESFLLYIILLYTPKLIYKSAMNVHKSNITLHAYAHNVVHNHHLTLREIKAIEIQ